MGRVPEAEPVGALTSRASSRTALVAIFVLLTAVGGSARAAAAPELKVSTAFEPATALFGDRILARVVVQADRNALETDRLRIVADISPLTPLGRAHVSSRTQGHRTVFTYEVAAICIVEQCLATHDARSLQLPSARVDAPRRGGGLLQAHAVWPVLRIGGRVKTADLVRSRPPFRSDLSAPATTYRIAPETLSLLLDIAAALLASAGVGVASRRALTLLRHRRSLDTRSELERALAAVRAAESAPPEQRRRAVGLLARLLPKRNLRLSGDAADLAWSEPKPTPVELAGLADRVTREVGS
jgi:hypothetical protein